MVARSRLRYWTLLLTLSLALTLYLTLVNISITQQNNYRNHQVNVKEIVAYSLLKQIEINSEEFKCKGQLVSAGNNNDLLNRKQSVELEKVGNDSEDFWRNIEGTNLFVYSVHVDRRLDPYHYIRIIGMVKGVVGCIDCTHVAIVPPKNDENYAEHLYINRKGYHSRNGQLIRDADLKILNVNARFAGSTNDSFIWNQSLIQDVLRNIHSTGERDYFLLGTLNEDIYCQISTEDGLYRVMKASLNSIWSGEWDKDDTNVYYNPVLLSCRVPIRVIPISVSLNQSPCKISLGNTFKLHSTSNDDSEMKRTFTVCVKPLNFSEDMSKRLIQWIEINRMLGADKIVIYVSRIRRNIWRILRWYQKTMPDAVTVRKFKQLRRHLTTESTKSVLISHANPSSTRNVTQNYLEYMWQKRRDELVVYNDCFYRNIHTSQFVVPLDIDEIIVPRESQTWNQLLNDIIISSPELLENIGSFTVQNAYYLREFTTKKQNEPVFFLRDITRSQLSAKGESGKSFISTKNTLTVFNHYALEVLRPGLRKVHYLSSIDVQMNHYKNTCSSVILPECVKYLSSPVRIVDSIIVKYKARFYENYIGILRRMSEDGIV